ncbi:hypothetical protein [Streptomyces doebereineriae]|uniref:hypothetical protein n=1 Tax=Streptomyces doebereineriae TaxID=3075528 RepID=UPI00374E1DF2
MVPSWGQRPGFSPVPRLSPLGGTRSTWACFGKFSDRNEWAFYLDQCASGGGYMQV